MVFIAIQLTNPNSFTVSRVYHQGAKHVLARKYSRLSVDNACLSELVRILYLS